MKICSTTGNVIYKRVRIRVFNIGNEGCTTRNFVAAPRKGYTDADIHEIMDRVADDLDTRFPQDEFRMIELGPNAFNFVWHGKREQPPAEAVSDGAR